ncbi:MAG TPA: ribbon-helix-helix domain-containing protein [Stenotrophomonas sp.]|nr:ribbon-helix-helix domain-containing protein [Stenotrophomonas sp.]
MKSCEFDIGLSVPRMRSIRVNGISTCFRLEEIYWRILDDIARRDHVSISVLVSSWARHVDLRYGGVPNLSSYIRICCLMHICGKAQRAARDPRDERGRGFTDSNWPALPPGGC